MIERIGRPNFEPLPLVRFVEAYWRKVGCGPTLTEIAQALGLSKDGAWYQVNSACKAGLLQRRRYSPRSIEVKK